MSETTTRLTDCHAFLDSAEAEQSGLTLRLPEA